MSEDTFKYGGIIENPVVDVEVIVCPKCLSWFGVDTEALSTDIDLYCPYCGKPSHIPKDPPKTLLAFNELKPLLELEE